MLRHLPSTSRRSVLGFDCFDVLTERVISAGTVDRSWSTVHQQRDADCFRDFFTSSSSRSCTSSMGGDTTVATKSYTHHQSQEFFCLQFKSTWCHCRFAEFSKACIHIRDHLTECSALHREWPQHLFAMRVLSHMRLLRRKQSTSSVSLWTRRRPRRPS